MSKKVVTPFAAALNEPNVLLGDHRPRRCPDIKAVKPLGGQVLVEILLEEEVSPQSNIILPDSARGKGNTGVGGAPQGYVLDIGPGLPAGFGIKVGDRVLLQGAFVPLPKLSDNRNGSRERALVEPHTIKAILEEESTSLLQSE
jgi:co-chaperonin GroES (HSP10)